VDYFNSCAKSSIEKFRTDAFSKKWKSIPGKISQKRVFFLVDRDVTNEEEIWIKMQIEN
jgi:hypothetical protein